MESPCNNCSAWVTDEFEELNINSEGDEIGTKMVKRSWCDAPHCIKPKEYEKYIRE